MAKQTLASAGIGGCHRSSQKLFPSQRFTTFTGSPRQESLNVLRRRAVDPFNGFEAVEPDVRGKDDIGPGQQAFIA